MAKLYDINPDLVEVQGFLDMLQELISDSNPTVVANAVAALSEIQASSGEVRIQTVLCSSHVYFCCICTHMKHTLTPLHNYAPHHFDELAIA